MPSVPFHTVCGELGCKNPRSSANRFCLSHGGKDTHNQNYNSSNERKASIGMYHSRQWLRLRQAQLSRQPLCAACQSWGRVTPAAHVDHLFPWAKVGKEAFYRNIFQSLCQPCHTDKTTLEHRGICRLYGTPSKDYGIGDYRLKCC